MIEFNNNHHQEEEGIWHKFFKKALAFLAIIHYVFINSLEAFTNFKYPDHYKKESGYAAVFAFFVLFTFEFVAAYFFYRQVNNDIKHKDKEANFKYPHNKKTTI